MTTLTLTQAKPIRSIVQITLASLFIALCAQIRIPLPFTPVPLTGQTFGVMLMGATLGGKKGAFAAALYLLQGALGAPVFAGGCAGFIHLIGPTGGYLLAYPLQAYLVGKTSTILIPSTLQLGIGTLWLAPFVGWDNCLVMGFYPFIPVALIKAALVTYIRRPR